MARYAAIRDRRLSGVLPVVSQLDTYHVDASISLMEAFRAIAYSAGRGRLEALFVLCHGYAGANHQRHLSIDAGGMGLQLAREGVMHHNVSLWAALSGKLENVVVYSCAAADTQPGNEGTLADGRYLMAALAVHTGAAVYAGDRIQWYRADRDGTYNFGAWEGTLLRFDPNGYSVSRVSRAPVEFSDVLVGCV